jgi:ribosomal protein S18 acetylase RimI-like enzyme
MQTKIQVKERKDGKLEVELLVDSIKCPAGSYLLALGKDGKYYGDFLGVRPSYTRRGFASMLVRAAEAYLGYFPLPKVILKEPEAQGFWRTLGWEKGVEE